MSGKDFSKFWDYGLCPKCGALTVCDGERVYCINTYFYCDEVVGVAPCDYGVSSLVTATVH